MCAKRYISGSAEETKKLAAELCGSLFPGYVLALSGELGSGKTTFVQGLAVGLGIADNVCSPTFKIVNEFHGNLDLYHIDFYRVQSASELLNLGLEEYLYGDGITVIEWADRFPEVLPEETIDIKFCFHAQDSREITISRMPTDNQSV